LNSKTRVFFFDTMDITIDIHGFVSW
jgi:hypothetical protein